MAHRFPTLFLWRIRPARLGLPPSGGALGSQQLEVRKMRAGGSQDALAPAGTPTTPFVEQSGLRLTAGAQIGANRSVSAPIVLDQPVKAIESHRTPGAVTHSCPGPRGRHLAKVSLWLGATFTVIGGTAHAAIHVMSPIVEQGEFEIETKADRTFDRNDHLNDAQSSNVDLGYGVNDFWATELETQWKQDPIGSRHYDSTSWENRFQLLPQGKYWLDAGLFAEYEHVVQTGDHNNATVGLLLQKEFGQNVTTLNFLLNREFGSGGAPGAQVDYRVQTRWRWCPLFQPGLELYGQPGRFGDLEDDSQQRTRLGPVATGILPVGLPGKLKYELGYLRGLNHSSEQGTLRALVEYEGHF